MHTIKYALFLIVGGFIVGGFILPFGMIVVGFPGMIIAAKTRAKSFGYILATLPCWALLVYWTAFITSFVHRQSARGRGVAAILWIVAFMVSLSPYKHSQGEERPESINTTFSILEGLGYWIVPLSFILFFFAPQVAEYLFYYLPLFDRVP